MLIEIFYRVGIVVISVMALEFFGALILGEGIDVAIEWAINIFWPIAEVSVIAFSVMSLSLRTLSKKIFLSKIKKGTPLDPKQLHNEWVNWKG